MANTKELRPYNPSQLGDMPDQTLVEGNLTPTALATLSQTIRGIIDKINGLISFGSGEPGTIAGNMDAMYSDVQTPGTPDVEFPVLHRLGRTPIGYDVVRQDKAVSVYDSSVGSWGSRIMYLKANVATASIRLRVY